jgi:hypothetical protein
MSSKEKGGGGGGGLYGYFSLSSILNAMNADLLRI